MNISKDQIWQKITRYCAYQERSHREAKEKLFSYKLHYREVQEFLTRLIEENYLNEARFATQYAGGKFRMNKWGNIKMKQQLQGKGVSTYNIKAALSAIERDEYIKTLAKLAEKKWLLLKSSDKITRYHKTRQYLMQKGFETNLINEVLEKYKAA